MSAPDYAYLDRALCLAPNLFQSLVRGHRGTTLGFTYAHGDATSMTFTSPVLLGCDDLRTLLGIVALATMQKTIVSPESSSAFDPLRSAMDVGESDSSDRFALVVCTATDLASAIGYAVNGGGALRQNMWASLGRLAGLRVEAAEDVKGSVSQLMAWERVQTANGLIRIVLNSRSTSCIEGLTQYAHINMGEARALRTDAARLLHVRLSAWIDANDAERLVGMQRLSSYIWGERALTGSPGARRQRQRTLRGALDELRGIGWKLKPTPEATGILGITRPKTW